MPTVYFVCIGNTCRSPMAAAIFNQLARERGVEGVRADSFGIVPFYGDSDDVRRLRESAVRTVMGDVDGLNEHKPKGIGEIAFEEGDKLILLDTRRSKDLFIGIQKNLSFRGKQFQMLVMETEDPFGGSVEDYVDCCLFLRDGIEENIDILLKNIQFVIHSERVGV